MVASPIAVTMILKIRLSSEFEVYVRVYPIILTFEESTAGPEIEYDSKLQSGIEYIKSGIIYC